MSYTWSCETGQRMPCLDNIKLHVYCKLHDIAYIDQCGRHVVRRRRCRTHAPVCPRPSRRPYVPASHDADDDDHEKMNAWVL